jgi:uncharacterized protein (TIGR00255 family)
MNKQVVSMTGFGRASATIGQRTVGAEIRSLNHRGLDVKLRAYDIQLAPEIEGEIIQMCRQRMTRGSIAISLRGDLVSGEDDPFAIARVRQMHAALDVLRQELGQKQPLDLAAVGPFLSAAKLGTVFEIPASSWNALAPAIETALTNLCAMRAREGAAIRADLEQRLTYLRGVVEEIAGLAAGIPGRAARRLEERLTALLGATPAVDPGRLAQEVAILAERFDVSEELVRLRSHFDHLAMLLAGQSKDAPGRRIDFLAQEIGRELNTLGAKVQDAAILSLVVDAKAELEKLREQAQNIE